MIAVWVLLLSVLTSSLCLAQVESVLVNCLFGLHSVSVGKLPRWVGQSLDVLIPSTALCAVLAPVVPFSVVPFLLALCYLGLIPFAAVVVISWRLQRGAGREMVSTGWAKASLMGWLAVLVGAVVTGLSVSGHLRSNAFTVHGFMFGASLQCVLMTAGLSYRLEWLQAELAKVNVQLQGKIVDLNAAIDLTQTEATRAAAAARAKGEVVATMTHELRTPLNAIINIPQGLQHDFGETPCARCTACNASFVFDDGEPPELPVACPSCGRSDALAPTTLLAYVGDPMRSIRYLEIVEKAGHQRTTLRTRLREW